MLCNSDDPESSLVSAELSSIIKWSVQFGIILVLFLILQCLN